MNNIIYYFSNPQLTTYNDKVGCKIGSTCDKISRMKTYRTGWSFIPTVHIFNLENENCYIIDTKINESYKYARLNNIGSNGGTEFYDSKILTLEELIIFFVNNKINFNYEILSDEDIKKICSNDYNINYDSLKKDDEQIKISNNCLVLFKYF